MASDQLFSQYCSKPLNKHKFACVIHHSELDHQKTFETIILALKLCHMNIAENNLRDALKKNNIILHLYSQLDHIHNPFLKFLLIFIISFNISCNTQHSTRAKSDVTGNWEVKISVDEGTIPGKGSLKQTSDVVTGWVGPNENDPIPITGSLKEGKLIMITLPQRGRTVAFDKVYLEIKGDTMSGTIEQGSHGKGTIKFIRSK